MPRTPPAPRPATPATSTAPSATRRWREARSSPPRDTPRSLTRPSSLPAPRPARPQARTALSAERLSKRRKRFPPRATDGMRARSRPPLPVRTPVSRPTPAQFAMQPRPKQSARPATRLFRSPKNRPPAPSPAIRPVRSAPFVRQSSPVWKKSLRPATQK